MDREGLVALKASKNRDLWLIELNDDDQIGR